MLTRVVIYRRHLRHSTLMPSSLRTLRLCVQLSSSQYSNLPPCKPSRLFSSPLYIIISSLPYLTISLPPAPTPSGSVPTIALGPLPAALMELPQVLQTKNLEVRLNHLDAILTKNTGGGRAGAIFHLTALFDPTSHLPYTLPSSVSRNPFVCHSFENCRVYTNNSHSETHHSLLAIPPAGSILWVGI